jgi:hypothetical protein
VLKYRKEFSSHMCYLLNSHLVAQLSTSNRDGNWAEHAVRATGVLSCLHQYHSVANDPPFQGIMLDIVLVYPKSQPNKYFRYY